MVQVNFVNDYKTVTTSPLTQWDYGQELQISGLTLPTAVQIHYATKNSQAATRFVAYQQGEYWVAKIPNALLEEGVDINAYIYTTDTDEGQTVKHIIIPVIPRLKPEDFISQPDPDEQEIIDELLAYVQDLAQDIDIAKSFSDVRIMTKAEYQALEEKENNVIYAFSDDSTLEEIEAEFDEVDSRFESDKQTAKKATNVTSQINGKAISDIFESNGTKVKTATYATTARTAETMKYPSYSHQIVITGRNGANVFRVGFSLVDRRNSPYTQLLDFYGATSPWGEAKIAASGYCNGSAVWAVQFVHNYDTGEQTMNVMYSDSLSQEIKQSYIVTFEDKVFTV